MKLIVKTLLSLLFTQQISSQENEILTTAAPIELLVDDYYDAYFDEVATTVQPTAQPEPPCGDSEKLAELARLKQELAGKNAILMKLLDDDENSEHSWEIVDSDVSDLVLMTIVYEGQGQNENGQNDNKSLNYQKSSKICQNLHPKSTLPEIWSKTEHQSITNFIEKTQNQKIQSDITYLGTFLQKHWLNSQPENLKMAENSSDDLEEKSKNLKFKSGEVVGDYMVSYFGAFSGLDQDFDGEVCLSFDFMFYKEVNAVGCGSEMETNGGLATICQIRIWFFFSEKKIKKHPHPKTPTSKKPSATKNS